MPESSENGKREREREKTFPSELLNPAVEVVA